MGLFLGCSLLTLFEFIDLFWNLLRSRKSKDETVWMTIKNPEQNETGSSSMLLNCSLNQHELRDERQL